MVIRIDKMGREPLYQQLRNQIVAAIATGELRPGDQLPSVRSLGSDLGINLHTVNKAYAILRDEGYVLMRGRAGAVVAEPLGGEAVEGAGAEGSGALASPSCWARADKRLADGLMLLALEYKAAGGARTAFEAAVSHALDTVYREGCAPHDAAPERAAADRAPQ